MNTEKNIATHVAEADTGWLLMMLVMLMVCLSPTYLHAASPVINIEFEQEQGVSSEWIRARANCHTSKPELIRVLDAVGDYPVMHNWISNTEVESVYQDGSQVIMVKFDFPWPVGEQWSRIELKRKGDSELHWHQLEGSLFMNRGRVQIHVVEQQAYIDYLANIDVGFANILTRDYKEAFVTEFLMAIYQATPGEGREATSLAEMVINDRHADADYFE